MQVQLSVSEMELPPIILKGGFMCRKNKSWHIAYKESNGEHNYYLKYGDKRKCITTTRDIDDNILDFHFDKFVWECDMNECLEELLLVKFNQTLPSPTTSH
jgi:hypothetical protein